jgi:hypothetical protein
VEEEKGKWENDYDHPPPNSLPSRERKKQLRIKLKNIELGI